ncbi:hypothetical protein Dda_2516 [Drechslerella dactyloides]|uniref:Protein SSH4 n=1 Tax=Drechslerella dactyloides TaxID=74499 RepID=A0AAD6IZM8_DREDA|nr:hypothetical protein Dda_2516 [Drechslerella dactyloides]
MCRPPHVPHHRTTPGAPHQQHQPRERERAKDQGYINKALAEQSWLIKAIFVPKTALIATKSGETTVILDLKLADYITEIHGLTTTFAGKTELVITQGVRPYLANLPAALTVAIALSGIFGAESLATSRLLQQGATQGKAAERQDASALPRPMAIREVAKCLWEGDDDGGTAGEEAEAEDKANAESDAGAEAASYKIDIVVCEFPRQRGKRPHLDTNAPACSHALISTQHRTRTSATTRLTMTSNISDSTIMAAYNPPASGGTSAYLSRATWASIVSGQPPRPRIASSSTGLRGQRNSSSANLSDLGSQAGRYHNPALSNALNTLSKISQLPTSVPSYLEDTLYSERLQAARGPSANTASLPSRNPSMTSLALVAQARSTGLKLDVKDTSHLVEDDLPTPLPTRWNENDKSGGIDISQDGLDVRFLGPNKVTEYDSAAVRADHHMPRSCGVYYYEVVIMNKSREGLIGVGFCAGDVLLNRLPGWEPYSWGYHGDDGKVFCCTGVGKPYGPQFDTKDIIGCGVNFRTNSAFFTINGRNLGDAFRDIPMEKKLYAAVGMKKPGEHIRVNFGQERFCFDIDGYVKDERLNAYQEFTNMSIEKLCPPLEETALIQSLVASYLQHDGFVETAKAFAQDLQAEQSALNSGRPNLTSGVELMEDKDALRRQTIRAAILDGNIDQALKLTQTYYPQVLLRNEQINFRLRCRKFIEMMRQSAELVNGGRKKAPPPPGSGSKNKGRTFETLADDEDVDMGEDDGETRSDWDMENGAEDYINSTGSESLGPTEMLEKLLEYGQQMQRDFKDKPELQDEMEEVFSLWAYPDPMVSPVAHLLSIDGRAPVAEALNSAILVSLGKSSKAPLERLVQQTTVLLRELGEEGGSAAFINLHNWINSVDYLPAS